MEIDHDGDQLELSLEANSIVSVKETYYPKEHVGTLYCSFCGKSQFEVVQLIAGPNVCICEECVELAKYIVDIEKTKREAMEKIND